MKTYIFLFSVLFGSFAYYNTSASPTPGLLQVNTFAKIGEDSANLQLADFLALYKKNNVILNWIVMEETDDDRFEIERSTDGISFVKTGDIASAGASSINTLYAFTDNVKAINTLKNDLYYRIKKIDKNGNFIYSKLLLVRVFSGTRALKVISITPNSAANNINVNVDLNSEAMVNMKVISKTGSDLLHKTVKGRAGKNIYEFEGTNALQKGSYLLEVIVNSNERMTLELIKD